MKQSLGFKRVISISSVGSLLLLATAVLCVDRQGAGRRLAADNAKPAFKSPCGTSEEVAARIGRCLDAIFELVEGKFGGEPKGDADLLAICDRFTDTEKCVRGISKDCLQGLHKTSTSAVASATKRFRAQECKTPAHRARYVDPLKCALAQGKAMAAIYRNHTAMAQAIRDLPNVAPEDKLIKMCCLLTNLDREMEATYNKACPKSAPLVIGIVHAMTDDARSTLCLAPKCEHALDAVAKARYRQNQNFIEPVMEILFGLNVN